MNWSAEPESANAATGGAGPMRVPMRMVVSLEAIWAAVGVVTVVRHRRRFSRPWLAAAAAVLVVADVAWTAAQVRRGHAGSGDAGRALSSGAAGLTAAIVTAGSVTAGDQFGGLVDWAFHSMLWRSARTPFSVTDTLTGAGAVTVAAAGYTAAVATRGGRSQLSRAAANGAQLVCFYTAGWALATNLRSSEAKIDAAQHASVEAIGRASAERARAAALVGFHGGSLEAMREIRALWDSDQTAAGVVARREAARLRRVLARDPAVDTEGEGAAKELDSASSSLVEVVDELGSTGAEGGLRCEVTSDLVGSVEPSVALTLRDSGIEAVRWLVAHHTDPRCVMRVAVDEPGAVFTLRGRAVTSEADRDTLVRRLDQATAGTGAVTVATTAGAGVRIRIAVAT